MTRTAVLRIRDLVVEVPGPGGHGRRRVIGGLDLLVAAGEVTALVGRSGSGKSLTARAVAALLPEGARARGSVLLEDGAPLQVLGLSPRRARALRGRRVGYVFQEAEASLNPVITVGRHLEETLGAHGVARARRRERGLAALREAGLPDPAGLWRAHPFELSGGQAQRVAIALASAPDPRLLIADEITSALDPVAQAAVLDTLRANVLAKGRAVLLITHDLAVAGRWADRIAVLEGGGIVEEGPAARVLAAPAHPFTRDLVRASRLEAEG